jgi:hypothetical protein
MYPVAHAHSKEPLVLVHIWAQPPLFVAHSSLSVHENPSPSIVKPGEHEHENVPGSFVQT